MAPKIDASVHLSNPLAMTHLGTPCLLAALLGCALPASYAASGGAAGDVGEVDWICRASNGDPGSDAFAYPNFALRAGMSVSPIFESDTPVRFETVLDPPDQAEIQFGFETQGLDVSLVLHDADGAECYRFELSEDAAERSFGAILETGDGLYRLTLDVIRRGHQDARLNLLWRGKTSGGQHFLAEAVPAKYTQLHASMEDEADAALTLNSGLHAIEEHGCIACHSSSVPGLSHRAAPAVTNAAARLNTDWLYRFLRNPRSVSPHSAMPSLLSPGSEGEREARDLIAYMRQLSGPPTGESPATESGLIERGLDLYHTVGCVACHGVLEDFGFEDGGSDTDFIEEDDDWGEYQDRSVGIRVSLADHDLANKWYVSGLRGLLSDPESCYPDGRMPTVLESDAEVDAVAAYLAQHFGTPKPELPVDLENAASGRRLFASLGCANCHSMKGVPPRTGTASLRRIARSSGGCLTATEQPQAGAGPAFYDFGAETRGSIEHALATIVKTRLQPAPASTARRNIVAANCRACHLMGGSGGAGYDEEFLFETHGDVDMGDEGRLPPHLDHVGFKLTTSWMRELLEEGTRARPYMKTRMPRFGQNRIAHLAEDLASFEGLWPDTDSRGPEATDERVRHGRELMGTGGLACMACHVYADELPSGLPGPDITAFAERLRYDWWRSYVHDPARFKPGTRMPSFSDGRRSVIERVLDGDARAQADALWSYFTLGEFMPAPEGVGASNTTRLQVGDRPRVFRSFLDDAGSRGIAVGFPSGLHFAFDANAVRVVDAWQGNFLDAAGAWNGRGGNNTVGQGSQVWKAPAGMLIRTTEAALQSGATGRKAGWRFRGYRLDEAGSPLFLSE
ncbi:MAG: mono/diheme cytochrome c family protein, partial [Planctomycetota bacterium]